MPLTPENLLRNFLALDRLLASTARRLGDWGVRFLRDAGHADPPPEGGERPPGGGWAELLPGASVDEIFGRMTSRSRVTLVREMTEYELAALAKRSGRFHDLLKSALSPRRLREIEDIIRYDRGELEGEEAARRFRHLVSRLAQTGDVTLEGDCPEF